MNPTSTTHGFIELPGAQLAYESAGQGDPVVFLHGGLLDGRMWDDQFAFFAQEYHAIRFDMRGAGQTITTPISALSRCLPCSPGACAAAGHAGRPVRRRALGDRLRNRLPRGGPQARAGVSRHERLRISRFLD